MAAAVEKRKDKRYLVQDLEVFMRDSGEMLGDVLNISLSGMLIAHDDAIAVGSVLKIKVALGHVSKGLSDFDADVQVMWFHQSDISGLFGSGLEFLNNTKERRAQIQEMINAFAVSGI